MQATHNCPIKKSLFLIVLNIITLAWSSYACERLDSGPSSWH
jgi:hypothetical protein